VSSLFLMNASIDFHHQSSGMAVEVNYETIDYLLAPEVQAMQSMGAKLAPENALLLGHASTKLSCPLQLDPIYLLPKDYVPRYHRAPQAHSPFQAWGEGLGG